MIRTSMFYSFSKITKSAICRGFNPILLENLTKPDSYSAREMPSEIPGAILFARLAQGCDIV